MNNVSFIVSGKDVFNIQIASALGKEHVRIHVPPPLDREDGSFLVRYRLYTTPSSDLTVQVLHKNIPVAKSPYILKGTVAIGGILYHVNSSNNIFGRID